MMNKKEGNFNKPLVSVLVAVYNVEIYLNQCIESIVNQTYRNIEIILVNDGSKDNSLSICHEWRKKDDRIKVKSQDNQGLAGARNTGLANCNGEWFYFVDGDDFLEIDAIEKILPYIDEETDLIITDYYVDTKSRSWQESFLSFKDRDFYNDDKLELIKNCYLKTSFVNQDTCTMIGVSWSKLYRTKMVKEHGMKFDLRLRKMQDAPFSSMAFNNSRKIRFISVPTYHYRFNDESITHKGNPNYTKMGEAVLFALKTFISDNGYEKELLPVYYARRFMFGCEAVKFIYILDSTGMKLNQKAMGIKDVMKEFCEKGKKREMFPYLLRPYKLAYILNQLHAYLLMYLLMSYFYKMRMNRMK